MTEPKNHGALKARIGVSGTLHVKRANGQTDLIELNGTASLAELLGVSEEQAQEFVRQHQQQQQEQLQP